MRAGPGSPAVEEWFIAGTEPQDRLAPDTCGIDVFAVASVERDQPVWMDANSDWIRRAERGPGIARRPGPDPVSYFYNNGFRPYGSSWGAVVVKTSTCGEPSPSPTCFPVPTPDPERRDPVVRDPVAVGIGRDRGTPLPLAVRQPVGQSIGDPVGDADADAGGDADPDAGGDADPDAGTDTDADAHPDPGRRGGPARTLTVVGACRVD